MRTLTFDAADADLIYLALTNTILSLTNEVDTAERASAADPDNDLTTKWLASAVRRLERVKRLRRELSNQS